MTKSGVEKNSLKALAGLVAAALLGMILTVVALSPRSGSAVPTLQFYCMNFNLMPDGTIQALVEVRVQNIEFFYATGFNLKYNSDYLTPSTCDGNQAYTSSGTTQSFFQVADDLYYDEHGVSANPFKQENTAECGAVNLEQTLVTLNLTLNQVELVDRMGENGSVGKVQTTERSKSDQSFAYIDTSAGVTLGEISFQVNPARITEMVEVYGGGTPGSDLLEAVRFPDNSDDNTYAWELMCYKYSAENYDYEQVSYNDSSHDAVVDYIFEFPDTLVTAELPADFVHINAWEGYTDGTWEDVSAALQRYAGQITLGYANGDLVSKVFPWGAENLPGAAANLQPDYKIYTSPSATLTMDREQLEGLADWAEVTAAYNPEQGVYKVEQYYLYREANRDGVVLDKRYPVARTAYLLVDPVTLTGAWAKDLERTYREADAPENFDDLRLPMQANLRTSPGLGKVSLTVPIQSWTAVGAAAANTLPTGWNAVGSYSFDSDYAQGTLNVEAKTCYPWLTMGSATLTAVRTVVADAAALDPRVSYYTLEVTREIDPSALWDRDHSLHFELKKYEKETLTDQLVSLPANSEIALYLPDGTRLDGAWFGTGYYQVERVTADGSLYHYEIELDGSQATGATPEQQEMLLRYINLGGWFAATVDEPAAADGTDLEVSNLLYAYLEPRANLYVSDHYDEETDGTGGNYGRFNFTGHYAGLLPIFANSMKTDGTAVVHPLSSTVVLPMDKSGKYQIYTSYDGVTGKEGDKGGILRTIKVDKWNIDNESTSEQPVMEGPWEIPQPAAGDPDHVLTMAYGKDPFLDNAAYDAYGRVQNPNNKQVEIWTEFVYPAAGEPEEKPEEKLEVRQEGIQAANVVFDTRQQGYVVREEILLTLKNTGDNDISGINLNLDYKPFGEASEGHFELTRAPATDLPAGGETSFILTYVYDLPYYVTDPAVTGTTYIDTISVDTNQHEAVTTFDAQFRVTKGPVSLVEVVTIPTADSTLPGENTMGSAAVIMGLGENAPAAGDLTAKPDSTPGNQSYEEGYRHVWIQANPISEYQVEEVYYYENNSTASGNKVSLTLYNYDGSNGDPEGEYYYFEMPGHRTTVYVKFYEPVRSKLRMSSLLVYGTEATTDGTNNGVGVVGGLPGTTGTTMIDAADADVRLNPLRRDDQSTNALLTYPANTAGAPSAAHKLTLTEEESSYPYPDTTRTAWGFSILPYDMEYVQLSLSLRQTLEMLGLDGAAMNHHIDGVHVEMTIPNPDTSAGGLLHLCDDKMDAAAGSSGGTTGNPVSTHQTYVFAGPKPGEELTVTITLSYTVPAGAQLPDVQPGDTVSRVFEVRLIRRTETGEIENLGYGNSPYGMIMNDGEIVIADKAAAKAAFSAGHTFQGVDQAKIPRKAQRAGDLYLENIYWTTGRIPEDGSDVSTWGDGQDNVNYDEDDTALFVLLGQQFLDPGMLKLGQTDQGDPIYLKDAAGNPVDLADVTMTAEVTLLDEAAATQADRFTGTGQTAVLALGDLGTASTTGVAAGWEKTEDGTAVAVRPGVYKMTYTFEDFDGTFTSFTRPLIILGAVGDVNADGEVTAVKDTTVPAQERDEALFENRVTDPLGYTLSDWKWAELFRLRTCDANNDQLMNHIDANHIRAGDMVPYYLPVDYK